MKPSRRWILVKARTSSFVLSVSFVEPRQVVSSTLNRPCMGYATDTDQGRARPASHTTTTTNGQMPRGEGGTSCAQYSRRCVIVELYWFRNAVVELERRWPRYTPMGTVIFFGFLFFCCLSSLWRARTLNVQGNIVWRKMRFSLGRLCGFFFPYLLVYEQGPI